jgi:hypothetical protein
MATKAKQTGIIKRENPLSLSDKTTIKPSPKPQPNLASVTGLQIPWAQLPKTFVLFQRLSKDLIVTVKELYPGQSISQIQEKALLVLLQTQHPKTYERLVKKLKAKEETL